MIQSIFNTSLQSIQSDMMNMLESLVPVVIAIVGAYLVVTFGITWLRNALGLNGFEADGLHFQNQAEYDDYLNGEFGEPEDYIDHEDHEIGIYEQAEMDGYYIDPDGDIWGSEQEYLESLDEFDSLVGTEYDYGYDLMDGDFY